MALRFGLFGSALRDDWDDVTSDFDFLAESGPPLEGANLFGQQSSLQVDPGRLLGRAVDGVDWHAAKRPHSREAAEAQARVVYAA